MSDKQPHQRVAWAILTSGADLRPKEGQFLGGVSFDANPLTPKQETWLLALQARYLGEGSSL